MNKAATSIVAIALIVLSSCAKWDSNRAPAGFAVVREHLIVEKVAFRSDLPIGNALDFTLTEIDGAPITRETIPPWVHLQRGALVPAGERRFKALAQPHVRPRDYQPKEVSFIATVESGKVYNLIDKDGMPLLIDAPSTGR